MSKREFHEEEVNKRPQKRTKLAEDRENVSLQQVPVELIWKILDYLDDDCIFKVQGLCPAFNKATTLVFYHRYNKISTTILSIKNHIYHKLYSASMGEETRRLDITKSLLYLHWIEIELVMLEGILLRYDVDSENPLFKQLWHVLKEILDRIDSLSKSVSFDDLVKEIWISYPLKSLPLWSNFIEQFDQKLEPTLGMSFPFETRVVDILSCCPSTNVDLTVDQSTDNDTGVIRAFFQIQDSCCFCNPKLEGNTDEDFEKAVLRYLRFNVRTKNSLATTEVYDNIRKLEFRLLSVFLNEVDRNRVVGLLEDSYRHLVSFLYQPLTCLHDSDCLVKCFVRRNNYNVSNNFIDCFLEKRQLRPREMPLLTLYPELFNVEKIDSTECRTSGWHRHPFELRVVLQKFGPKVNISVKKEEDCPKEGGDLSYTVEQATRHRNKVLDLYS